MADIVTTKRMDSLIDQWEERKDPRVDFLRCYRLMTANMLTAIEEGEFHDGPWVRQLLDSFADYYFTALDEFEQDHPGTPAVWSAAYRAASNPDTLILQNLLLGINAHINYDLVLTLFDVLSPEWDTLSSTIRQYRYEDHSQVNTVIGRTIDVVQDSIIEPREPLFQIMDVLLGPVDEWVTSLMIRRWREEVWQSAQEMLAASDDAEREILRQKVEALTLQRARAILLSTEPERRNEEI